MAAHNDIIWKHGHVVNWWNSDTPIVIIMLKYIMLDQGRAEGGGTGALGARAHVPFLNYLKVPPQH